VAVGILGVAAAVRCSHARYLGAILAWAVLPLALQCGVGADLLRARAALWTVGLAVPVLYWWAIDRAAICWGVWRISGQHTLGPRPWGLPVEEAVFFLVTSALVVNSVLLGTDPVARTRLRRWRPRSGTRPRVGVPMVLITGRLAAEAILATESSACGHVRRRPGRRVRG
jgi:lycopene cyclase domain-containing protein